MKKFTSFALAFAFVAFACQASQARLFEDKCNPTPKCDAEPVCYGCAPNKPQKLVELEPCAYKNKPYNYYTWKKVGEKEVASDMYDWAGSPEGGTTTTTEQ
jgi:hypothetical protein